MNPQIQQAAGSPLWQLVFLSFAVLLILFEVLRGWRLGVARQLARLVALIAAYFAAFFGGKFAVPIVRPFFKMPDALLSILAGAVLALMVYAIINGLGAIWLKRTRQHDSFLVRFLYGSAGAVLGFFFGAFLIWLLVVGVRSVGAVADARVRGQKNDVATLPQSRALHVIDVRPRPLSEPIEELPPLLTSLARLRNSLEMGVIGDAVKKTDFVPTKAYEALGKVGQVVSSQKKAERFLSYPGARNLTEHPKIAALRSDPEISQMIAQRRLFDLLQNEKIRAVLNDRSIIEQIKNFDLQRALDYALEQK
ncbi:MAG: hypothetical protein DMF25_02505 [Verrucomicrobia bacterium]|nr:MAG: hypothetical protein DMF25_02505 [Verrucomicrobiota bacterium]